MRLHRISKNRIVNLTFVTDVERTAREPEGGGPHEVAVRLTLAAPGGNGSTGPKMLVVSGPDAERFWTYCSDRCDDSRTDDSGDKFGGSMGPPVVIPGSPDNPPVVPAKVLRTLAPPVAPRKPFGLKAEPRKAQAAAPAKAAPALSPTHVNVKPFDGVPKTGRALWRWAKDQAGVYEVDVIGHLTSWGREHEQPVKIADWGAQAAGLAYIDAVRYLRLNPEQGGAAR